MKNVDNVVCMVYYMGKLYNKSVKAKKNPVYTTTLYTHNRNIYTQPQHIHKAQHIIYTQLHKYKITCEKNRHCDNMTQLLFIVSVVEVIHTLRI